MKSETSLVPNGMTCALLLGIAALTDGGRHGGLAAFLLACGVAVAGLLVGLDRASKGDDLQFAAVPVTGLILAAILGNFAEPAAGLRTVLALPVVGVAIGVPIMMALLRTATGPLVVAAGTIAGVIGVGAAGAAFNHHVPGFNLFVPLDRLKTLNLFHVEFFHERSMAEVADRAAHNAGVENSGPPWGPVLFVFQTVIVCGWDAAILSLWVFIPGLVLSLPAKVFVQRQQQR